jgi:hypothetical protein
MKKIFLTAVACGCFVVLLAGCAEIEQLRLQFEYAKKSETPLYSVDNFTIHPDDFVFVMKQFEYKFVVEQDPYEYKEGAGLPTNVNSSFETTQNCYTALRALAFEELETRNFFSVDEMSIYIESLAGLNGGSKTPYFYFLKRNRRGIRERDQSEYSVENVIEQIRSMGNFITLRDAYSYNVYVIYYFEKL